MNAFSKELYPANSEILYDWNGTFVTLHASNLVNSIQKIVTEYNFELAMNSEKMITKLKAFMCTKTFRIAKYLSSSAFPFSYYVDIGYHWTHEQNLESIHKYGLLSRKEQGKNLIDTYRLNGCRYGDGIYTADHPETHYRRFGTSCLLVARLQKYHNHNQRNNDRRHKSINLSRDSHFCVPLMRFDQDSFLSQGSKIYDCQIELQKLLDTFLHEKSICHFEKRYRTTRNRMIFKNLPQSLSTQMKQGKNISPIGVFAKPGAKNPFCGRGSMIHKKNPVHKRSSIKTLEDRKSASAAAAIVASLEEEHSLSASTL